MPCTLCRVHEQPLHPNVVVCGMHHTHITTTVAVHPIGIPSRFNSFFPSNLSSTPPISSCMDQSIDTFQIELWTMIGLAGLPWRMHETRHMARLQKVQELHISTDYMVRMHLNRLHFEHDEGTAAPMHAPQKHWGQIIARPP